MRQRLEAERRAREAQPKDTTHGIWDVLYKVKVPMMGLRGVDDIRMRGTVLSGNKDVDNDIRNRKVTTWLSIDAMLELFRQDVVIGVCDLNDTKAIYNAISDHTSMWKMQLERGINVGSAPVKDLLDLNEFAKIVFEQAKWLFKDGEVSDANIRYIQGVANVNPQNFFNPKAIQKLMHLNAPNVEVTANGDVIINGQEEVAPERDDFDNFFKEQMINLSSRRGDG